MEKKKIVIPTLTFNGDYFKCPKVRLDLSRAAACTGKCGTWHTLPTVRQLDA